MDVVPQTSVPMAASGALAIFMVEFVSVVDITIFCVCWCWC